MKYLICVGFFIIFDSLTGFLKALKIEGLNSTILRKGFYSKLSEILAVLLCYGLNFIGDNINLGFDVPLLEGVSIYLCLMELVSIIENLCEVNPALDKLFGPYLEKLKGKKDDEESL